MRFTLPNKRNKLIFLVLIECATKSKKRSIIYIALNISITKAKTIYTDVLK